MGRAKIVIKKIEPEGYRKVTYMKRRVGLLKKAYEISILADVEVMLIIFAPYRNKHCFFSLPNRLEDVLIKLLNMADEHRTVRDVNGRETRIAISDKESLITLLENTKLKDDTWAAEQRLRIKQANSGPKTSDDDNQSSQHIEMMNYPSFLQLLHQFKRIEQANSGTKTSYMYIAMMNSLSSLQKLHQFKRFYETATPTTFEECFDYNEEMLKRMLFQVTQQMNFVQSMTMNSMSLCPYNPMIHGESSNTQSLCPYNPMIHGESSNTQSSGPYNPMIHGESSNTQSSGPYNPMIHGESSNMQSSGPYNPMIHGESSNTQSSCPYNPMIHGESSNMQSSCPYNPMIHGESSNTQSLLQQLQENWSLGNQTNAGLMNMQQQQLQQNFINRQQGLAAFYDQKNKQGQGSAYNINQQQQPSVLKRSRNLVIREPNPSSRHMQQGQGSAKLEWRQELDTLFDHKNIGKMVDMEPNVQQGQGSAYNMKQRGLAAVFDQKIKGKMVDTEPNPASTNMQQQHSVHRFAAFRDQKNKGKLVIREPNPAPVQQQQWASQYGAESSSTNNERIYPTVEQNNYNQMGLPTGANSSHGLPFSPPMLHPNISWNPTYHTTAPPHYGHQQSFGDDVKNCPDLGQYNDKPNSK